MTDLKEKTNKYREMLSEAIDAVEVVSDSSEAEEFLEMAESYHRDGNHFLQQDDAVNALAAYSYGHAWLDAGVRAGYFETTEEHLFTV